MTFSAEQLSIFDWFSFGTGSLIVKARAGTGKTTTIKEAFNHAPESERRILYAVFNKRNQKEAESKIKDPRVEVKTLHSLGFAFIKRVWSNAKPDDEVEFERINKVLVRSGQMQAAQNKEFCGLVAKLVSFAKNTTVNPTASDLRRICEERDIDFAGRSRDCDERARAVEDS
jgi:superfamily I DNA/RNA helicase